MDVAVAFPVTTASRSEALNRLMIVLLIAACTSPPSDEVTSEGWNDAVVIVGARVFDGTSTTQDAAVVVRDGLIESVGPSDHVPASVLRIDGTGATLLPGFIDAHTHTREGSDPDFRMSFLNDPVVQPHLDSEAVERYTPIPMDDLPAAQRAQVEAFMRQLGLDDFSGFLQYHLESVAALHQAGVTILAGSDPQTAGVVHGIGLIAAGINTVIAVQWVPYFSGGAARGAPRPSGTGSPADRFSPAAPPPLPPPARSPAA